MFLGRRRLPTGELAFDAVELSGEDWGSAALSLEGTPAKVSARGELGSGAERFQLRFSAVLEDFLAKPTLGAIVSLTAGASAGALQSAERFQPSIASPASAA